MDVGKLGSETPVMGPVTRPPEPAVPFLLTPPADAAPAAPTDQAAVAAAEGRAQSAAVLVESPPSGPPPEVLAARQRLEAVVLPKVTDDASPYGQIRQISLRPNEYTFYWTENKVPLEKAMAENKPLVSAARQKLDAPQRADFDRLWKLTTDDIGARAALQLLLLEGTLAASSTAGDEPQTLLTTLAKLADSQRLLAGKLDRTDLICDLMQEIAFPTSISQRHRGTCTVTSAQILMAMTRPAEYARIVAELATADPAPVRLAGGGEWLIEPCTDDDDDSQRTQSSRLFQAAAMEAMLPNADYDDLLDTHVQEDGAVMTGGGNDPLTSVVRDLLGPGCYVEPRWQRDFGTAAGLTDAVIQSVKDGHPTLVTFYRGTSAEAAQGAASHEILVVGATDAELRFVNPWGQVETATREAASAMILSAIFVNTRGPEAPAGATPTATSAVIAPTPPTNPPRPQ